MHFVLKIFVKNCMNKCVCVVCVSVYSLTSHGVLCSSQRTSQKSVFSFHHVGLQCGSKYLPPSLP